MNTETVIGSDGRPHPITLRQIIARAVLRVLEKPDGVETVDWQIADAVLAALSADAAESVLLPEIERLRGVAQGSGDCGVIEFEYCNWEGRKSLRQARPISVRFGKSEWHPKPQWLMLAFDIDRDAEREFAMVDMAFEDDALGTLSLSSTNREGEANK